MGDMGLVLEALSTSSRTVETFIFSIQITTSETEVLPCKISVTKAAFLLAVQRLKSSSTITPTKFSSRKYDLSRKSVGHYMIALVRTRPYLGRDARYPSREGAELTAQLLERVMKAPG